MCLTAFIILAAIFLIWFLNEARKHRPRSEAEKSRHQQHVRHLYETGQVTHAEMQQMILLGTSKPLIRYSNSEGGLVPSQDADRGYARETGSGTAAFWDQQDEHFRQQAIRREEGERERQWRDEEDRRRHDDDRREHEYWEERRHDDEEYYRRQSDNY